MQISSERLITQKFLPKVMTISTWWLPIYLSF